MPDADAQQIPEKALSPSMERQPKFEPNKPARAQTGCTSKQDTTERDLML